MPRPRSFNPDEVLQIATDLFWEKGYFNASVDELVRQSGVAKYGIYGTFGTKRELFKKALQHYAAERHRDIQAPIRRAEAALPEIQEFFSRALDMITGDDRRRGCLMVNTGLELGLRDDEFKNFVRDFFDETESVVAACLDRAVASKQIDPGGDTPALAAYLVNEFRTMLMLAGSDCPKSQIQAHLEIALHALE